MDVIILPIFNPKEGKKIYTMVNVCVFWSSKVLFVVVLFLFLKVYTVNLFNAAQERKWWLV